MKLGVMSYEVSGGYVLYVKLSLIFLKKHHSLQTLNYKLHTSHLTQYRAVRKTYAGGCLYLALFSHFPYTPSR